MTPDKQTTGRGETLAAAAAQRSTLIAPPDFIRLGGGCMGGIRSFFTLLVASLSIVIAPVVLGQAKPSSEHELKAAVISKLPMFVKWPDTAFASPQSPIVVGVLGTNAISPFLEAALRGKTVANRIVQFRVCTSVDEAASCHVVVITESDKDEVAQLLQKLDKRGVLTVSDLPDFATRGGMVGLAEANRKVSLEVNPEAVQAGGLRVDPHLLQLAKVVRGTAGQTNP